MKRPLRCLVIMSIVIIAACSPPLPVGPTPTPTPPQSAEDVARQFLGAWEQGDYIAMYDYLSPAAQAAIGKGSFIQRYYDVSREATVNSVHGQITDLRQDEGQAQVSYHVAIETATVGTIERDNTMHLSYQQGRWGIDWGPQLIFPELTGQNLVHLFVRTPARANIYDRNGLGLATQAPMVTVGVVPGQIQDEPALLAQLSWILGMEREAIRTKYAAAQPEWFIPIKDIPAEVSQTNYATLSALPGVQLREKWVRAYRDGGVAAHVVGYVGMIDREDMTAWKERGYRGGEIVGKTGLERWGEPYLAGRRGGTLVIITPEGQTVTTIQEGPPASSRSIYATIDRHFQQTVEGILGDKRGAIVVMDVRNGQVLAMASYPTFDPNPFATGISDAQWRALANDPSRPLVNRATQGEYAPGSVFKIVTMAAALEKGGFAPTSIFNCPGYWEGLGPEWRKPCWLKTGHGELDLVTALAASCDVTFYELGKQLDAQDHNLIPDFARQFGLGQRTGIEVDESAGLVPDPAWKLATLGQSWFPGDPINLAIGQGYLLVTPLQITRMVAAVANGGTLYRPQLVLKVDASPDEPEQVFAAEATGKLPISDESLAAIQEGMLGTTTSPRGTATFVFKGSAITVAGKTGTAENPEEEPHAWFAGYAPASNPQIAVTVIIENGGEGSKVAAPLFRQVVEAFFQGE